MTSQKTRKQATVHRILGAAAQMFAETGYEGARIDAIAELAGVNKAMIYYHIGDKKALYTQVLHQIFGDVAARMTNNINRARTPLDKIRAYIASIRQTLAKHPYLPPIMMHELASGGHHLPEIVANDLASIIGLISDVVAQGCRESDFNRIDPFVLHLMVIGGVSYFKTSDPLRLRYAKLMGKNITIKVDPDGFDLLKEIEAIIVSALSK